MRSSPATEENARRGTVWTAVAPAAALTRVRKAGSVRALARGRKRRLAPPQSRCSATRRDCFNKRRGPGPPAGGPSSFCVSMPDSAPSADWRLRHVVRAVVVRHGDADRGRADVAAGVGDFHDDRVDARLLLAVA